MHRVLAIAAVVAAVACSSGSRNSAEQPAKPAAQHDASTAAPPAPPPDAAASASSDAGGDASTPAGPCSAAVLAVPRANSTYYVAVEEPGADNDACDGLSATDAGNGHCPFKDFTSDHTLHLLDGVKSTRLEVRRGHYVIHGWDGLRVAGTGLSAQESVVLSAYPGEHPVLDVAAPDGAGCTAANAPDTPACVREVVRVSGSYTVVQGLTIQNGLAYHVEVTGGDHHLLRCNTLGETVAFPMRSDCMKLDAMASQVEIRNNDFSHFRSQAIDMARVFDVLVEDNEFHDPIDADAGATGAKFGVHDITIRGNRVHDMGDSPKMHAFALGGTGSEHQDDYTAYEVHVEDNRVSNIRGILAQVTSCMNCSIERNDVWNAGAGILLTASGTGRDECALAANGCKASSKTRIANNRMRALDGGGDAKQANVFVVIEPGEDTGLDAADNLYCAPAAADARFGFGGEMLGFDAWAAASGTDASSHALPASDAQCTAF